METIEESLYDFVSEELFDLANEKDYPLNPKMAIWCFAEGLHNSGVKIKFDDEKNELNAEFKPFLGKILYCFDVKMDYRDILRGWGEYMLGSPNTLHESVYEFCGRIGAQLKKGYEKHLWACNENKLSETIADNVNKNLKKYFNDFQENLLSHISLEIHKPKKPEIIKQVLKDYPVDILKKVTYFSAIGELPNKSPHAEDLLDCSWDFDPEKKYPNVNAMMSLFWGEYLDILADEKGYQLINPFSDRLKELVMGGNCALKNGREMLRRKLTYH